jgi:Tol biopolymer transport system component
VVFGSTREDNNSEIFLMRTNGSNILRLTDSAGVDDDPVWSPDGRQIAYESDTDGDFDVWVMNVDGSGAVNLTDSNASTDWSPDWIWVPGTLSP